MYIGQHMLQNCFYYYYVYDTFVIVQYQYFWTDIVKKHNNVLHKYWRHTSILYNTYACMCITFLKYRNITKTSNKKNNREKQEMLCWFRQQHQIWIAPIWTSKLLCVTVLTRSICGVATQLKIASLVILSYHSTVCS